MNVPVETHPVIWFRHVVHERRDDDHIDDEHCRSLGNVLRPGTQPNEREVA